MIKITLLLTAFIFTGCMNKNGVSAKYYSDCKEYYDLQGFYHKKCSQDDIATYKEIQDYANETMNTIKDDVKNVFGEEAPKKKKPQLNVW